mmetsp:Transcript_58468/g.156522  ORF Transcript_58468/g.156522 Transcript_58468/m.156522 type:complete len:234 (-) Transcript_58468:514-1215(-)
MLVEQLGEDHDDQGRKPVGGQFLQDLDRLRLLCPHLKAHHYRVREADATRPLALCLHMEGANICSEIRKDRDVHAHLERFERARLKDERLFGSKGDVGTTAIGTSLVFSKHGKKLLAEVADPHDLHGDGDVAVVLHSQDHPLDGELPHVRLARKVVLRAQRELAGVVGNVLLQLLSGLLACLLSVQDGDPCRIHDIRILGADDQPPSRHSAESAGGYEVFVARRGVCRIPVAV